MKRIAVIIIGGASALVILMLILVINFSEVETRFECPGTLTKDEISKPTNMFFKLKTYRWWVHLWSEWDANAWVEMPNELYLDYFEYLKVVGNQVQIFEPKNEIRGYFSTLSNTLRLITPFGSFDGSCKDITN